MRLSLALFLVLFSCSKSKIEHRFNFKCQIIDSSVYQYRTCANSRKFDSINYFSLDPIYGKIQYINKTKSEIIEIEKLISCDTQIISIGWLYCGIVTHTHNDLDTTYNFKKISCPASQP